MMKKSLIIILAVVLVLGAVLYFWIFGGATRYKVEQGVPADAVFVLETPSFNGIHESLRRNRIWSSLKAYPYFEAYHDMLNSADSVCDAHPVLKKLLTDRPFAVSCHPVSASVYDFLYVCDLGKLNVIQTFDGTVGSLLEGGTASLKRKGDLMEVVVGDFKFYYGIKANLLLASCSEKLVRNALDSCGQGQREENGMKGGDLMLRVNHQALDGFLGGVLGESGQEPGILSSLSTTVLTLDLEDEALLFKGRTSPDNKQFSVLTALNLVGGARAEVSNIAGNRTATCVSLCFSSFPELKNILLENYKLNNLQSYTEYEQTLNRLNKFLGLNVAELFTSWIGSEIAFIKPEVDVEKRLDNVVVAIRAKDMDLAKDQMAYLVEQLERKTPVRFRAIEYNGHTINYLSLKGFFNLFLGSWFEKLDKPYYTFMGDYVVFSNSSATLATMIKDYSLGNTLANDEKYRKLMDKFGSSNNVYGYINSPATYDYLYNSFKPEERGDFAMNKGAFESFENIGFVLANAGSGFETSIVARHNADASEEYKVKELNSRLLDLADRIESGYYLPVIPDSIAVSQHKEYTYSTVNLSFAGTLNDGDPIGVWTLRDSQNRLVGQITYQEGKPHGESSFFYPEGAAQVRVLYHKGQIESYRELFPDGTLKMEIEYSKGVRHGDIKFYYSTGHLYGEGKYKKGRQAGTWKYYQVTGEVERKVKF